LKVKLAEVIVETLKSTRRVTWIIVEVEESKRLVVDIASVRENRRTVGQLRTARSKSERKYRITTPP
jgi:hypothetical protein